MDNKGKSNIKILDCTLRDGGYVNDWEFKREDSKNMIDLLDKSGVDYIETGFIQNKPVFGEKTLFNSFSNIKKILPKNINKDKLFGMITYGKFFIDDIPDVKDSPIGGLRVIFKKGETKNALQLSEKIKEKGYKLFINLTFIDQYSDKELYNFLDEINQIKPYSISIVDSMGVLRQNDVLELYYKVDKNTDKDIAFCFHSHNNLQLSFQNAQVLIDECKERELIIDCAAFGMGRGAGNLPLELLVEFLNKNYGKNYNHTLLLKLIDEFINPIYYKTPWGYSIPYYLSGIHHCHPNYAKYLVESKKMSYENMDKILNSIPKDKKANFDIDFISKISQDEF